MKSEIMTSKIYPCEKLFEVTVNLSFPKMSWILFQLRFYSTEYDLNEKSEKKPESCLQERHDLRYNASN